MDIDESFGRANKTLEESKHELQYFKDNYKAIIKRTPDIGSFGKNPLRIPLTGGILWLSIYMLMYNMLQQLKKCHAKLLQFLGIAC